MGPLPMSLVMQVGDIVNVAADLASALEAHTDWRSTPVTVAELRRSSKLARLADLPRRALRTRLAVTAAIATDRPDVVHLHWARYAPFLDVRGLPLVIHAHGSDVRGRGSSLPGRLVSRALSNADAVLVSTLDLLAETAGSPRYLPNPINVDLFTPSPPPSGPDEPNVFRDHRPTVLLFARLIPIKGADRLVAAALALRAKDPGVRAVAISGGELDDAAAAAGVELLPPMGRPEIARLIHSADVVVGQQLLGILSLSELEAMACGRPVVTPLRRDLYGADAPTVDAEDADAVADHCLELIGDSTLRSTIGAASRQYVVDRHAPRVVAQALASVYEALV